MNPSRRCWLAWCVTMCECTVCHPRKPTWNRFTLLCMKKRKVCNELARGFCCRSERLEGDRSEQGCGHTDDYCPADVFCGAAMGDRPGSDAGKCGRCFGR